MKSVAISLSGLLCVVGFVGCGSSVTGVTSPPVTPPAGSYSGSAFAAKVLAGSTPLVGATVQVYAAGTTGNGSAPTLLTTTILTTDSNGSVSVAAGYTCPASTSIVYVVAAGGHVGSSASNSAVRLMSSPGICGSITANASYVINELTTVASAYAFAQFLGTGAQLGATSTNSSGITLAAGTLANIVNITTGSGAGSAFPSTGTSPIAKLNTLANLLNACVVSSGSGSSACSSLFSKVTAGTPPTNTLDAALDLVKSPGTNVASLYSLSAASSAFTPVLAAAPSDWTLFITYAGGGMNDPSAISIDSKGNVWVASYFATASLFTNTGKPVYGTGLTGNGLGNIYGGTVDANDVMWIANEPASSNSFANSVTLLNSSGAAVSGSPYTAGGLNFPISISVDQTNISWIVDYGNSHLTLLNNAGAAQSGTTGYDGVDATATGNFIFPVAVAVDSNRNGWVANQSSNTITKVSTSGPSYTSYIVGNGPSGVAVDANNNVWSANYYGDSIGAVAPSGSVLSGTSGFTGGGVLHPQGIAADGAGTVWVANYRGPSISQLAGVGSKAGTGVALSPAAGWAPDAALLEAFGLAIDASGNIWVSNFGSNTITEFVGMASPVKTPLLGATRIP
jgi:streptogramin lyase